MFVDEERDLRPPEDRRCEPGGQWLAEPREALYLGGNADLYVLVDPCNGREVEMVPVSTRRLVVIDEVTCADGAIMEK